MAASPDGKWIVFQSDHGGDEIYDLYATPASGGAIIDLTNTPDVDDEGAFFSPDCSVLAFTRRAKTESSNNIAVMDFASHGVRQLTQEATKGHTWTVAAFSHDGKSILADRTNATDTEAEAWLIDICVDESGNRRISPQRRALQALVNTALGLVRLFPLAEGNALRYGNLLQYVNVVIKHGGAISSGRCE